MPTQPEQPDKALLWTNDQGAEVSSFADMKRETSRTASYFKSLGIPGRRCGECPISNDGTNSGFRSSHTAQLRGRWVFLRDLPRPGVVCTTAPPRPGSNAIVSGGRTGDHQTGRGVCARKPDD